MTERGNPKVLVRFPQEAIDKAQEAFPPVKGRSGGVALALRRLLYLALDETMPPQYGEIGRSHEVDKLETMLRQMENEPLDLDESLWLRLEARKALAKADDAVDVLRLQSILGRLWLLENPLNERSGSPE